jgi:hypothetical protein
LRAVQELDARQRCEENELRDPRHKRALEVVLVVSCVIAATAWRLAHISREPLWVDEAESSINALTILERGYPSDRYLGLPIYENVLVTTSPDSKEYEFRDSSYSDRGMAIYHGWLPLYSIAAAEALGGIHPDIDDGRPPMVRHSRQELIRRTVVPRLPSIVFAVVFLCSLYLLGRRLYGIDTAASVLMAAGFAQSFVWFGWQARYYSATLAFTALSGLTIWTFTRRNEWRDSIATGCALALLFHTHSLSFFIMTSLLLVNAPLALRQPRWIMKLLLTGTIVACAVVPWMYWTNFFHAAVRIPAAWPLLTFPGDFVSWFTRRKAFVGIVGVAALLTLLSAAFPRWQIGRRIRAAAGDRPALYFALTWFTLAYLMFMFLIPAASFAYARLLLVVAVPGYLLFALCIAIAVRTVTPRFAVLVSPLIIIAFVGIRGSATLRSLRWDASGLESVIDAASRWTLAPGTKLYSWPNQNLELTYYSGLPVQSIAPVRKTFLDSYPGDVIFLEIGTPYVDAPLSEVLTIARQRGAALSVEEARESVLRVQRHGARQYLRGQVADIWPPPESLKPIDLSVLTRSQELSRQLGEEGARQYPLLRKHVPTLMLSSMWLPVFYEFVDPEKRLGDRLNYRDRIRDATGIVLPNGSLIFDARRRRDVPLVDRAQYLALQRAGSFSDRDSTGIETSEDRP